MVTATAPLLYMTFPNPQGTKAVLTSEMLPMTSSRTKTQTWMAPIARDATRVKLSPMRLFTMASHMSRGDSCREENEWYITDWHSCTPTTTICCLRYCLKNLHCCIFGKLSDKFHVTQATVTAPTFFTSDTSWTEVVRGLSHLLSLRAEKPSPSMLLLWRTRRETLRRNLGRWASISADSWGCSCFCFAGEDGLEGDEGGDDDMMFLTISSFFVHSTREGSDSNLRNHTLVGVTTLTSCCFTCWMVACRRENWPSACVFLWSEKYTTRPNTVKTKNRFL
mmetsp:Transcript_16716/g.27938  ORF Transcript_16716/g.27938 Transcript_16716/m.27938 type:complete len:279 (+) Transcript_16716:1491-2327(+)